MKRFQYRLETVLNYKTQVLDELKTQHAAALKKVNVKKEEIAGLNRKMDQFCAGLDEKKRNGSSVKEMQLFDICIGRMEDIIQCEKEKLVVLREQEQKKKEEVIRANVDTARYEKLKDRRLKEYHQAEQKELEQFIEEFVSHTSQTGRR